MSQIISTLLSSTADLITYGLTPLPYLRFSVFDLIGSLRLALVLRQIRESERQRGIQEKQRGVNSKEVREIEDAGLVKDLITMWTVVYGGEMVCAPWLHFTPSFLTTPSYVLLFGGAQALVNLLPSVPPMGLHTEFPFAFFDALTRTLILTINNPGFIVQHASESVRESPWALGVASLVLANAGFLLANALSMLSPFGYTLRTPPEFLPGGWTSMDLWAAPLITCLYALLTCGQPCWVPAHRAVMRWLGRAFEEEPKGVDELTAQAICALVLIALFSWRALATHGLVQAKDVKETDRGNGALKANGVNEKKKIK